MTIISAEAATNLVAVSFCIQYSVFDIILFTESDNMQNNDQSLIYTKYDYSEDQIGYIMHENYVSVNINCSVSDTMSRLISEAAETEYIQSVFATDAHGKYIGYISLPKLIIARKQTPLSSIIESSVSPLYDTDSLELVSSLIGTRTNSYIPVLEKSSDRLIGILTQTDISYYAEETFEDDYAMFASLTDGQKQSDGIFKSMSKRIPWLFVLLLLSVIVSSVVGLFEGIAKEITAVVCFQSLILGMSGNAGTQSLAVTIREITSSSVVSKEIIAKEAKISLLNGTVMGSVSFVIMSFYFLFIKVFPLAFSLMSSAVIAVSLAVSMFISAIIGVSLPLVFKKINIDPAVASGPLITTFGDLCSVCVFYGLCFFWIIKTFV